jgi:glutamate N-acetyltransferase/amino-acid N-acetyltransferase
MKDGVVSAIVLNAGGANCYTGMLGFQVVHATAEAAGAALDLSASDVLVCSTGLIGEQLDRTKVLDGVRRAADALSTEGGEDASAAILTTDTRPKRAVRQGDGYTIGAMAKGAGMLAPGLATMLVVITTDADLESPDLDAALRAATAVTFDRLDSDGCMSTNDQVTLLASGASGVVPELPAFTFLLTDLCRDLALQLQSDAEGASHDIAIETRGAVTEEEAVAVSRAVARSNLFKAAVFGNDPNWGRVLAAVGTTDAEFDPFGIDVTMNGVRVCQAGQPDQPRDLVDLTPRAVDVVIDLHAGDAAATVWTNDLTHDYVHENSAYSS